MNWQELFTETIAIVGGLSAILGFWTKYVWEPYQNKREQTRHEEMEEVKKAIEKANEPIVNMLKRNEGKIIKLEDITEMHEDEITDLKKKSKQQYDKIYVLTGDVNGVKTKLEYIEKYLGGDNA